MAARDMARTLQPEDQISHYRVVGPLGAGGMGEVYAARDETLERSVALKVLPPHLVRNEERVRRFITEAKSASSLNHPNIVTIYEIGQENIRAGQAGDEAASETVHYISMELVTGETLTQMIHSERTELKTLIGYLAQAAEGIAKAHQAGIVHRDLKPSNIMISKDGFAKVLDFGLAKLTEKQASADEELTSAPTEGAQTGAGVIMGTVGYMSPEQVQGKSVDHRSDIFSMGCIVYEAATRRRPFVADTDVEVMHQILRERPRPVEEVNPEVPAEIRRIIRRCLAKGPDQRFQSMKDLAIDLREAVEEWDSLSASATSATSAASSPSGVLGAATGRSAAFWGIVLTAVVLGLGGVGFGIYTLIGGRGAQEAAGSGLQDIQLSVLMSRNDLRQAVLSGDGRYLAYSTTNDRTTDLTVRQVRTGSDVKIIEGNEFEIGGIGFSPDGDYLYYLNRDPNLPNYQALFQVPSLGGTPRKMVFDVDTGITFSPDGKKVCWRRGLIDARADSLVIGDLETGEERELIRVQDPERFGIGGATPAWSPDGARIAIPISTSTGGFREWLAVVDVASGERTKVGSKIWVTSNSVAWLPDGSAILVSAFEAGSTAPQIYRIAYPGGEAVRMTNDLDGYQNISLSADGRSIAAVRRSSIRNLWVARGNGEIGPITFASGSAGAVANVTPLPGGAVAFSAPLGQKTFLWRMEADGSGRRQLSSQGQAVLDAAYAPGVGIVFTQVEGESEMMAHLWRMAPDGTGLKKITSGTGEQQLYVSKTGNALLFNRWEEPGAIWALDPAGGDPWRVSERASYGLISPDGTRILISRVEGTEGGMVPRYYIVSLKGGDPLASFSLPPGMRGLHWSPDGKAVTFVDRRKGWNLFRKALPDGAIEPLTSFREGPIVDHVWSPDGTRILVHRRFDRQESLWTLTPGEAEPVLVTEFKTGQIAQHNWAPDNDLLYFTYGDSTQDVVILTNLR